MKNARREGFYNPLLRQRPNCNGGWLRSVLALAVLLLGPGPLMAGEMQAVEREAYLMGTICTIQGEAPDRLTGLAAIEEGFAAIRDSEALLSTWRDDTPLAMLAQAPMGQPVPVPVDLASALSAARAVWDLTGGAFDPSIGALVSAWDLRGPGRIPTPEQLATARARSGMQHVAVDRSAGQVTVQVEGLSFDAGGFGKGEGLARAAAALEAAGLRNWMIDFGGQVMVAGEGPVRDIPVAHPSHRDRSLATLRLLGVTAATSSPSEKPGHILDPRNGRPVTFAGSVTVIGADPLQVDALSTGLFVLGPQEGLALAAGEAGVEVLYLVPGDGGWEAHATEGLHHLLADLQVPLVELPVQIRVTGQSDPPTSRGHSTDLSFIHDLSSTRGGSGRPGESRP